MPWRDASPELDQEFERLVAALRRRPNSSSLQRKAANAAYSIRSRCIDLASWQADYSPEYSKRIEQATTLTKLAGEHADETLLHDFGRRNV
jgi:hypothetical protein